MLQIKPLDSLNSLSDLKLEYLSLATAALDGMWLCGFVPMAQHFGFYHNNQLVGYCCINAEKFMLQFYLRPQFQEQAGELFNAIFANELLPTAGPRGAFVSTAEPQYLAHCLDQFDRFEVNALMYQLHAQPQLKSDQSSFIELQAVNSEQLTALIDFTHTTLQAPQDWLRMYYGRLIERREVYAHWLDGQILAVGECRSSDIYQQDYADLGMIVSSTARGQGIATKVLKQLTLFARNRNAKPICSTEKINIAAQKAIGRAGFIAVNRIVQFDC